MSQVFNWVGGRKMFLAFSVFAATLVLYYQGAITADQAVESLKAVFVGGVAAVAGEDALKGLLKK